MNRADAPQSRACATPEVIGDGGPIKPFLGHLEDLRRVLLRSAAIIAALFCLALTFAPQLFTFLKWPLRRAAIDPDQFLRAFTVTGGITLWMQMAFWAAVVAGAPLLLAIWTAYLLPALNVREQRMLVRGLFFGALLFLAGATLAFAVMLPPALRVMLDVYGWLGIPVTFWAVDDYAGFCLKLMLAFGITFEMPVVLLALGYLGIITARQLANFWRHAIVIALIVSMVVTPTTDPISQIALAAPLILLYGISILLLWRHERRQSVPN
ncbi:MAG: twin-arginine translocase subunit TatC [bacterium]